MQTTEQHIDAISFWTPRGQTAFPTSEDMDICERQMRRSKGFCYRSSLGWMLHAERSDRFSYGPSLKTMVDYVTEQIHKETVAQAFAVRS